MCLGCNCIFVSSLVSLLTSSGARKLFVICLGDAIECIYGQRVNCKECSAFHVVWLQPNMCTRLKLASICFPGSPRILLISCQHLADILSAA